MKNITPNTSTLPIELLEKQAEYIRSFQRVAQDEEMQTLAEEGLADYTEMLDATSLLQTEYSTPAQS